ncbi:MAG: homoserine dehydrogenase, partial [Patescibacteria group bacterium]|nr:homoserine dehydrogenase [Patescibacteria group bacterium]
MKSDNHKVIKIGVIGFGTVGSGVVEYLIKGGGKQLGIELKKVAVSNINKKRNVKFKTITNNANELLNDPEIKIIVEVMGGINPAREFILKAMKKGKSVVTANKAVLSRHAKELFEIARLNKVNLAFEASVGGGIPIIRTINSYKGDKIKRISAVINGTTNYILTQMEKGQNFEEALKIAQKKGFAEANHILDTGGFDSRDKIAILAMLAFNTKVNPDKIPCRGITEITSIDIDFAKNCDEEGYSIKLLATAEKKQNGEITLGVSPTLVKNDNPLAFVKDEFNAIYLESELAGPQIFLGKGAGKNATTSAVISDIRRVANNIRQNAIDELPTLKNKSKLGLVKNYLKRGYIRVNLKHVPGSAAKTLNILAKNKLIFGGRLQ